MALRILTILLILNFSFTAFTCHPPERHVDYTVLDSLQLTDKKYFCIGDYNIYPHEKRIIVTYCSSHGETGNSWEGVYLDTVVNFDSTTLVFVGEKYDFEEHINVDLDVKSLKLLDYNVDDSSNFIGNFFADNNQIYVVYGRGGIDTINIGDMKKINDWLYEKDDNLYFLSLMSSSITLCLVDKENFKVDIKTLKHVTDNCFTDKNGFYRFEMKRNLELGVYIFTSVKLEDAISENPDIKIGRFYIVYGNSVYSRETSDWFYEKKMRMRKLNLNGDNLKEYPIYDFYDYVSIITDGKNAYRFVKQKSILEEVKINGIENWKQLTSNSQRFSYIERKSELYFGQMKHMHDLSGMTLFYDGNCFILLGKEKEILPQKVFINGREKLDIDNFKYIGGDLYTYKNVLYNNFTAKINWGDSVNIDSLKPVQYRGYSTHYFTDGSQLFYNGRVRDYTGRLSTFEVAESDIKPVDFESLMVVNRRMLVDKNNIYIEGEIIPQDSLGVKIKVVR